MALHLPFRIPIVTLIALAAPLGASADTLTATWISGAGDWTSAANWDTPDYPANGNPPGTDYNVVIQDANVQNVPTIALDSLSLGAGVQGTGTINVGDFTWTAGALGVSLTASNSMTIQLPVFGLTLSAPLINASTSSATLSFTPNGAFFSVGNGGSITNNGLLTAGAGLIDYENTDAPDTFVNNGTLTINASSGALTIKNHDTFSPTLFLQNSGLITISSGSFDAVLSDTGATSGSFQVAAGASLLLGDSYTFTSANALSGSGAITFGQPQGIPDVPGISFAQNFTFAGTFNPASIPVRIDANATIGQYNSLADTSLSGAGTLTLTGLATFTQATVSIAAITVQYELNVGGTFSGTAVTVNPGAQLVLLSNLTLQSDASIINNGKLTSHSFILSPAPHLQTSGSFTNNGTMNIGGGGISSGITFNNNGVINITNGVVTISGHGTDSASARVNVSGGTLSLSSHDFLAGTLNNQVALSVSLAAGQTATLGSGLTFQNIGTTSVTSGELLLASPQDPATTGIFSVAAGASLELAASYDFSSPTDPTLTGSGEVIIDPGITLTLAIDSAFSGTILDNGTLILAPDRSPGSNLLTPNFTVLPTPEPASLALLSLAAPLLLRRRHP